MSDAQSSPNTPSPSPSAAHALMSKSPAGADPAGEGESGAAARGARKPSHDADDEKAAQLGIRATAATGTAAYARPTNLRRSSHALQLFGLLFVVMLLLFAALLAGLFRFYERRIEPFLGKNQPPAAAAASPAVPAAVKIEMPAEVTSELAAASAKVTELQKQIDSLRDTNASLDARLREVSDRVTAAATAAAKQQPAVADIPPTPATEPKPGDESSAPTLAASPTNQELVLLKERNRLTAWADEAIATGNRKSLDKLIGRLTDPDHVKLRDAAFTEIQRVYYHLRFTIRIDPGFRIPVNEMFKDSGIRDESDLKTEQLIKLLHDQEQPWQVRLRSAWLLGGRRTPEVNEALVKAVKTDVVLDVAKEAQLSLEQNIDRKFLLLDIPAIDEWVKSQQPKKEDEKPEEDKKPAASAKDSKPEAKKESSSSSKKKK